MTVISGYGLTETAPILTISHLRPEHASLDGGESRKEVEIRTGLLCRWWICGWWISTITMFPPRMARP